MKLFFKRLVWKRKLSKMSTHDLLTLLRNPDVDIADLLWSAYVRRVGTVQELMTIVYDDGHQFPFATREAAGETVITMLRHTDSALYYLGADCTSPTNGRAAYLSGIALCLPQLRSNVAAVAEWWLHEREKRAMVGVI